MSCYTIVVDPYDWFPPYGENQIEFYSENSDVIVDLYYDTVDNNEFHFAKRSYIFKRVAVFCKTSFPGIGIEGLGTPCENKQESLPLGRLFQVNNSVLAKKWTNYWEKVGITREFKQYTQFFTQENLMLDIVCNDFSLSDEILLKEMK
jgi:hypothetical protein